MRKAKILTLIIIILISIAILIYSFYKIYLWENDNINTNKLINKINELIDIEENKEYLEIDLDTLIKENNDTIGWLYINNTNINYPVVQTTNNEYYLSHSFDKSDNSAGWIFFDYRNNLENLDKNTIIYGHNRKDESMFGSLKYVLDDDWYLNSDNLIIKLSTVYNNSLWEIFSIYTIDNTTDYLQIDFDSTDEFQEFIELIKKRSIYDFNTSIDPFDYILTLSTCNGSDKKLVVHAKLISIL